MICPLPVNQMIASTLDIKCRDCDSFVSGGGAVAKRVRVGDIWLSGVRSRTFVRAVGRLGFTTTNLLTGAVSQLPTIVGESACAATLTVSRVAY